MSGQPCETLPSTATNTDQKAVTTGLFNDTRDPRNVFNGKPGMNKIQCVRISDNYTNTGKEELEKLYLKSTRFIGFLLMLLNSSR